jgi:hypothetical protein
LIFFVPPNIRSKKGRKKGRNENNALRKERRKTGKDQRGKSGTEGQHSSPQGRPRFSAFF